ncbi:GtrA family protein [Winslowiella sp. 2C04]|uniref:GtrA family protein n=1 Tax=Winslowiella sp. 2C04 TaxID=3416179 RepID=UPI003CF9C075
MLKTFKKYVSVGVINTCIHWAIFAMMVYCGAAQALANFSAFCVAVTFSFFANARWTFNSETTTMRYMIYVLFMGSLASVIGWVADMCELSPVITLIFFSAISLICGFVYSKFIVFKDVK